MNTVAEFEASWLRWASKHYEDPTVAQVVASAAYAATRQGISPQAATIVGHRAAVAAGGEYVCRPDRAGIAIAVCVLVFLMFVPASLAGLTVNPGLGGYLFLAGSLALPALAVAGLVMVRRNSCFFVNWKTVGRRNWRGQVVMDVYRRNVTGASVRSGEANTLWTEEPDESTLSINLPGGVQQITALYWWSNARAAEFAAVARP